MRFIRQNKYRNRQVVLNGLKFDSQKEAARWQELQLLERDGQISELRRQVTYELLPSNGNERGIKYRGFRLRGKRQDRRRGRERRKDTGLYPETEVV